MEILNERIERAFTLTFDLFNSLEESNLQRKIGDVPSNSIGQQAWCIVGARESYYTALKNSKWMGFKCTLDNYKEKSKIIQLLESTKQLIVNYLNTSTLLTDQLTFAFDLLEHEIQHHGQLIRHFYSNRLEFPPSWNDRYTV
ncbi:MAG: hypothetical protein ACXAB7_24400 [Candidatus Kariarchaeaceae archaeon]|jgi:hypothetical protein